MSPSPRLRLGVSSCLLGERVRYDGDHKLDRFVTGTLGKHFEFVPVCPEVAIGLGVPRPPLRLVGDPAAPRAVGTADPTLDITAKLAAYGRRQARRLDGISGYILKSRSPSCGMERVQVYGHGGHARPGRGVYAAVLMERQPLLPVEEEGRLGDPALRDNFLERVFACRRWQEFVAAGVTARGLVDFHGTHKLALLAHGDRPYRELDRLVARAGRRDARRVSADYIRLFMAALKHRATRTRHAHVLRQALGHLKQQLDTADKTELLDLIDAYRRGTLPLAAPVTLLRHHCRRDPNAWIGTQVYLYPDPREFILRYGT
jgi:uncharacterized protein YbgA (DUF1722 family)/uncharacterized protein YbbK (DUF523 family)